jgi:hypothetical protein
MTPSPPRHCPAPPDPRRIRNASTSTGKRHSRTSGSVAEPVRGQVLVQVQASAINPSMESHFEKLQLLKDEILRDLSEVEADEAAVRAMRQAFPRSYPPG